LDKAKATKKDPDENKEDKKPSAIWAVLSFMLG
jgi:hypothetical protein